MSSDIFLPLKSIVSIRGGKRLPAGKGLQTEQNAHPYIRVRDIGNRELPKNGLEYVPDEIFQSISRYIVETNDVILSIVGTVGSLSIVDKNHHLASLTENCVKLSGLDRQDALYLYYYLVSNDGQYEIAKGTVGAVQPKLPIYNIEKIPVPWNRKELRYEIATILGALDDRITLLRETNATLEAIAQALFKSWFVDFDPVHAKMQGTQPEGMDEQTAALFPDSFVESVVGLVPAGWEVKRLDSFLELAYGKALKATDRINGTVPVYGSGGITGYHNQSLVNHSSVVIGRKGTVGSLYWEDLPFFPIDTVFYVRSDIPMTYCFYLLQTLGLDGMNTDAAVPGLNRNNVYRLLVSFPTLPLISAFHDVIGTVRDKIFDNNEQIKTLANLRDTLLPRLISGQLRVGEI